MNQNLYICQGLSWNADIVIRVSLSWAKQFTLVMNPSTLKPSKKFVFHFSNSWVRMNTDCLIRAEDAFAAAGGILVDHNGRWIIGFTRYLGNCVVLDSEL